MTTIPIPTELIITINTSIPGFQKLHYTPQFSLGTNSNEYVLFNPFIKLNQSQVNKVPPDIRIKQFFYRNLFDSLLRYNKVQPVKTLDQAFKNGIINNNIIVTLNTLFAERNKLYVGAKPYTIAGFIIDDDLSLANQRNLIKRISITNGRGTTRYAVVVSIDMELILDNGQDTTLSLNKGKCNLKWQAFLKSYSALMGKPYVIQPKYNETREKKTLYK
jgi:hypothetical protein